MVVLTFVFCILLHVDKFYENVLIFNRKRIERNPTFLSMRFEADHELFTASTAESREAPTSERGRGATKDATERPDERWLDCRRRPTTQTPPLVQLVTPTTMCHRHHQTIRLEGSLRGSGTGEDHVSNTGRSPRELPTVPAIPDVRWSDHP